MQEAAGDQAPVLVVDRDRRAEQGALLDERPAGLAEAEPGAARHLAHEGDDADGDQRVGDDRLLGAAGAHRRRRHDRVLCPAHSGQRMPTGDGVMQSGQIGRPHEEQETPVSRSGWR